MNETGHHGSGGVADAVVVAGRVVAAVGRFHRRLHLETLAAPANRTA